MPTTIRFLIRTGAILLFSAALSSCNSSSPTASGGGGELNGSLSAGGGQYMHTFAKAGVYNYHCTIHPTCSSLTGTIVVMPSGSPILNRTLAIGLSGGSSGYYGSTCSGLSVQLDTVFVGDQVTWTNSSPFAHTVTSQ